MAALNATHVMMKTEIHGLDWRKIMEDKTGAASYLVSLMMALFGMLTFQEWGVIAGILGILATLGIKIWESRAKVKIAERANQAALDADRAKREYYEGQNQ